ncbi:hypothetical protein [Paractinoplanes rishiriensis]|uniref:Uncharacterized protein n=1 Tax=Paractinoplanes rishiriensis TaxID=1050105 RepID=A0A919JX17_9ACTN|nr:hypothetical protein [Actinoplanes rishiriensis]GIE95189.1 hypothetical protein Ari01nite_26540 [Actinoplanes rishiriensis]
MNAPRFSVHVDQDDLAKQNLAAGLPRQSVTGTTGALPGKAAGAAHHGAQDGRQAARDRSERDHARGGRTSKGRSYAFRRS